MPIIEKDKRPMTFTIIEGERQFKMVPGGKELPHPVRGLC